MCIQNKQTKKGKMVFKQNNARHLLDCETINVLGSEEKERE